MWGGVGRTWVGHTHTHDGATWYHTTGDGTTHVTQILCHMVMKVRYDQGRRVPRYRCESLWPLLFLFYSYYHYFFSFFYESKCTCKVQGVALRYSGKGTGCYGEWRCMVVWLDTPQPTHFGFTSVSPRLFRKYARSVRVSIDIYTYISP